MLSLSQTEKQIESNQIKTTIESDKIENCESNWVKSGDQKNCWCQWWVSRRQIRCTMGGLVTRRYAHGNYDVDRYAWARRNSHRCSRRCSVSVKLAGFHVMGMWSRSLGASFVPADWQMRVFGPSGIIDRSYDRLYVRTIPLSGCMGRCSHYILPNPIIWKPPHFSIKAKQNNSRKENKGNGIPKVFALIYLFAYVAMSATKSVLPETSSFVAKLLHN